MNFFCSLHCKVTVVIMFFNSLLQSYLMCQSEKFHPQAEIVRIRTCIYVHFDITNDYRNNAMPLACTAVLNFF